MPEFSVTSNAHEVLANIKALVTSFGFDQTIEGKTLGNDIAGLTADRIAARSLDRESGADGSWPANSDTPSPWMPEGYRVWKQGRYGVDKPNVRTGQMLSIESLIGGTVVSTHEVQMLYGTGKAPTTSSTGMGFNPKTDGEITDIEKAYFCSTARPFYELDDEISDAVFGRIEQCLTEYLLKGW